MTKIPSNCIAWADVWPYGKVFLRKFTSFGMIKVYRCVQDAAPAVVPRLLEYYHFIAPLSDSDLRTRLRSMGYSDDLYIAGLSEISFAGQTFITVMDYAGRTLIEIARTLKESGRMQDLLCLVRSLGTCLGTLHHAGLICDDTHDEQFVVDESLTVRRIDVHGSRVRMDIVGGHPIFGGLNEPYFENRRLTLKGFEVGVQTELRSIRSLSQFLDKECFSSGEAERECREGYLGAGGTQESWASAEMP